jgi:hypothetical protein
MSLPTPPRMCLRRRGRGRFVSERGVALIEFALVLPFLLLIVFGMVDLGKAVSYWNDETHLANQAARYAAVNSCSACGPAQTINQYVIGQAETKELADNATITIQFPEKDALGAPLPKNHCATHSVKVIVSYDYTLLSFVSDRIHWIGPIHIRASSTQRLEQDWGDNLGNYRPGVDKYDATGAFHDDCASP